MADVHPTIQEAVEALDSHSDVKRASVDTQSNVWAEGIHQGLTDEDPNYGYVMVQLHSAYTEDQYREPIEEALEEFDWELADEEWGSRFQFQLLLKINH